MNQNRQNKVKVLSVCYFVIAFFEVIAEYFQDRTVICILKPVNQVKECFRLYLQPSGRTIISFDTGNIQDPCNKYHILLYI